MRYSYTHEKLSQAVDSLATGTGSIQDRLLNAALALHVLRAKDFPEEMANEFSSLWQEFTKQPAMANEGTLQATILRMSDGEAAEWASRILHLHSRISDMDRQ
jgi:hypothetical protein